MPSVDAMRRTLILANAFKEGDLPLGGTRDDALRADARQELLSYRIGEIRRLRLVDDGVTEALERSRDRARDSELDHLTIARAKALLLSPAGAAWAHAHRDALASEVVAALAKVMTDDELAFVSSRLSNPLADGIGAPAHFGSRIQPNSPGDDEEEILFSVLDGLAQGCGDVIIGLNPAADEIDTIVRLEQLLERIVHRLRLPTRFCVLSDIVKQDQARARTRIDVGFQSLAGTSAALVGMVGMDVDAVAELCRGFGAHYFETGQGSAVTNGTAEGIDMVTLEARAYGVARHIQHQTGHWMIVNDVAGFIGPEVFRSPEQLERACLEDLVMARLHGITMGLDVCATFHMGISPRDLREITARVVRRGAPSYLMAVAGNADPMLGYLTTSCREHPALRQQCGTTPTPAMRRWLSDHPAASPAGGMDGVAGLYAEFAQAGGDRRPVATLEAEGRQRVASLREGGLDIAGTESATHIRVDQIYEHARRALFSRLEETVIHRACGRAVRIRSRAVDRDDYIAHPGAGERVREEDIATLLNASGRRGGIRLVVSDGLNADAVNEQLPRLLLPVRDALSSEGHDVADVAAIVQNGRVRAGYHVAGLLDAEVLIHVIGERPGTGLNTVSAYLTYGRDSAGRLRWDPLLDHSCTTAVCGIHPNAKPPETAAAEIVRTIGRMLEQRRSGVTLR